MLHEVATPRAAFADKASCLQGPILVLGASGFVAPTSCGRCMRLAATSTAPPLASPRGGWTDCPKTASGPWTCSSILISWRLVEFVRPRTIFHCVAYGAYRLRPTAS